MNKRASLLDIMFVFIALFVFSIGVLIAYTTWDQFKETTNDNRTINWSSSYWNKVQDKQDTVTSSWDYIFMFFLVGLTMVLVISTFALKTHPAFFWISLLLIVVFLIIAGALSNVYEDVGNESTLSEANDAYPIMEYVFDNYPFFLLIVGAIVLIALYAKSRFESGGGY